MPSTYQRLVYIEQERAAGRLNAILLSPDGPQALIPALPEMVALIEAAYAELHVNLPLGVERALLPLIEDRP